MAATEFAAIVRILQARSFTVAAADSLVTAGVTGDGE